MGHRLDDRDEQERDRVDVRPAELPLPRFEQRRDEHLDLALDRAQVLESPDPGNLFDEHLVERGIDGVRLEHRLNDRAHRHGHRRRGHLGELGANERRHRCHVARSAPRDEGLLAGEVLVERADADAGGDRDSVRARVVVTRLAKNASSRVQNCVNRRRGAFLTRFLSGCRTGPCGHEDLRFPNASCRCER